MIKYSRLKLGLLLAISVLLVFPHLLLAAPDPVFDEVKALVEAFYVDPVDAKQLNVNSSQELLAKLGDEYSLYMTAAEFEEFMGSIEGQYAGIGVYLNGQMLPEGIEVSGIIGGSPAEKAGLKAGDVIVRIDQKIVGGLDLDTVCGMLLGPAGTRVQIEVKTGQLNRNFTLFRQIINIPVVNSSRMDFNTAYIDIDSFSEEADQDLADTMASCRKDGADKWIIDLRGNPGGYIDSAIEMAGIFIGPGVVTVLEERDTVTSYRTDHPQVQASEPVIILIDENSASASEILAAALRDHRKAILLGSTTYGKGTVQEIYPLSNGDWLKLTTARFYSPLGIPINGIGVDPDLPLDSKNIIKAAELLLSDPPDGGAGSYELQANGHGFVVDLALARSPQYWEVWGDVTGQLQYLPAYKGAGGERYDLLTTSQVQDRTALYYPNASSIGSIDNYSPGRDIVLYISQESGAGWNADNIEMLNSATGEQLEVAVEVSADKFVRIKPFANLLPGEYWVIFNDGQQEDFLARIGVQQ
ncbi:carboxyl-terminal protease [hydrocarbon metagenome]|uniref:Carboxyl-terminal protease n=1 Tax=hydrocarbon metagenome TaxID=938273 RepID=A0A0W8E163_9ZZZZ